MRTGRLAGSQTTQGMIMNARIFAIAASLALGATVAQANPFEGDQAIAAKSVATTGLTRAEVRAQAIANPPASGVFDGSTVAQQHRVAPTQATGE